MDFVEELPTSEVNDIILIMVDRLTKYPHFIPMVYSFIAITVVKAFMD